MISLLSAVVRRSVARARPLASAYSEGNMLATITIERPALNTFNRSTGGFGNAADISVYTGKARIYELSGGQSYAIGEEMQYFSSTRISVPIKSPVIWVNDDVEILSHPDSSLVGKHFRVLSVDNGGLLPAVRTLTVTGAAPAPNAI